MTNLCDDVQVNTKSVQNRVCVGRVLDTTLTGSDRNRETKITYSGKTSFANFKCLYSHIPTSWVPRSKLFSLQ